jgi:hypothetical protein
VPLKYQLGRSGQVKYFAQIEVRFCQIALDASLTVTTLLDCAALLGCTARLANVPYCMTVFAVGDKQSRNRRLVPSHCLAVLIFATQRRSRIRTWIK